MNMTMLIIYLFIYLPGTLSTWTPADGGAYSFTNTSVIMAGGCRAVVDLCLSGKEYIMLRYVMLCYYLLYYV